MFGCRLGWFYRYWFPSGSSILWGCEISLNRIRILRVIMLCLRRKSRQRWSDTSALRCRSYQLIGTTTMCLNRTYFTVSQLIHFICRATQAFCKNHDIKEAWFTFSNSIQSIRARHTTSSLSIVSSPLNLLAILAHYPCLNLGFAPSGHDAKSDSRLVVYLKSCCLGVNLSVVAKRLILPRY